MASTPYAKKSYHSSRLPIVAAIMARRRLAGCSRQVCVTVSSEVDISDARNSRLSMSNEQVERLLNYPLALNQGNETNLRGKLILSRTRRSTCKLSAPDE